MHFFYLQHKQIHLPHLIEQQEYLAMHPLSSTSGEINESGGNNDQSEEASMLSTAVDAINELVIDCSLQQFEPYNDFPLDYTSKYSLSKVRAVDNHTLTDAELTSPNQVPGYILKTLMIADYHAREFKLKPSFSDNEKTKPKQSNVKHKADVVGINPMDAMLAVFHCSDDFLREYLSIKLSACQLSVPFLLPDPDPRSEKVTMLLSALQSITKTWKGINDESNANTKQVFATEYPFPVVSFLRIGETMSKSSLINKIMRDACGHHNFFFHRKLKGGNYKRKIVDGLVELTWYFPRENNEQALNNEICIANLRGDATYFKKQFHLLTKISSVLCFLLPIEDSDSKVKEILNDAIKSKAKVILIFKQPHAMRYINDLMKGHPRKFSLITKVEQDNEYEFLQVIRQNIQAYLHKVQAMPLVELGTCASNFCILPDSDQSHSELKPFIDSWLKQDITQAKKLLKLQMHVPTLALLEREINFPKRLQDISKIYENVKDEKIAQRKSFDEMDERILIFLNRLAEMNQREQFCLLSTLRHQLDKMSLEAVAKLHQDYRNVLLRFQKQNRETSQGSDAKSAEQNNLKQLETSIAQCSFGLEHILRELAQLYQLGNSKYDYAGAAAEILLSGLPLELLDGDSSYIPLEWFNAVYSKLAHKTNDAKIFVISVLGIQSSGKSTLLNTMFGLELPVSAGRCTRSAFASLIPISDSFRSESKFDYLLIIDTEGLKGSGDLQLREHDNELATFAIGVADLTIVNIFGENHNEMKQFLEIAVHAFLKMRLASKKKNCKIVHQNVSATDATDKLIVDRSNLKLNLDKMTKLAAIQENCEDKFEKLDDVISFNENEDVFYIPSFLKGSPPMAPVNPEYGKAVQKMKDSIINLMSSKEIFRHSFSQFRDRVCALWKAMLKENFIFSFRNTMEVKAFTSLDRKYFQEFVKLMVIGMTDLEREIDTALKRCSTREERVKRWKSIEKRIHLEAEGIERKMKEVMENFIDTSEDKAILEQWREYIMKKITQQKEMQEMEIKKNCTSAFNYLQDRQDAAEKERIYKEELIRNARKFITSARDTQDVEKCKEAFDQEWQQWIVCVPHFQESKIDVENEMLIVLCETDAHLNGEMMGKLRVKNSSLLSFKEIDPRIDICQVYDSNRKKDNQKQQRILSYAQNIRDEAVDEALNFVKTTSQAGIRCTRNDLTQLYHKVITTIEEKSNYYSIKFFKGLKCDILLYIFGCAYESFAQMEERYLKERDIRGNLEKTLRPKLEAHFLNLCKKMRKEVLAATSFVDVLKNPIEFELNQSMGPAVAKEVLKKSMFQSKGQFHADILIQLGEEGKFEPYIPYLRDPVDFLKKKLKESIHNYCLNQENASINLLLKNLVEKFKAAVREAISKAYKETKTRGENLKFWIQLFVKECHALPITNDMFAVVVIDEVLTDFDVFNESVDEKLLLFLDSVVKSGINYMTIQNWNPSPHDYLLTSMFGCEKYCPFCKCLCDQTVHNHAGSHSTRIHRPQGVSGYHDLRTNILDINICTNQVAHETRRFKNKDTSGEWHPCKDYQSVNDYYKSWSIPPDTSFEASTYWQWFMATFLKDLSDYYKRKEPEIPSAWKRHSFKDVKEDLQKEYNMLEVESECP